MHGKVGGGRHDANPMSGATNRIVWKEKTNYWHLESGGVAAIRSGERIILRPLTSVTRDSAPDTC